MGYYKIKCYIVTKWWHSFFLKQRALCLIPSKEFICYFGVADGPRLNTRCQLHWLPQIDRQVCSSNTGDWKLILQSWSQVYDRCGHKGQSVQARALGLKILGPKKVTKRCNLAINIYWYNRLTIDVYLAQLVKMIASNLGLRFKPLTNKNLICGFFTSIMWIFYFQRSHYRICFRPLNMLDQPCLLLNSFPAIYH